MSNYPVILYPPTVERILAEFPPPPPLPQLPSKPIIRLEEKPSAPIIPVRPEHPGKFTKLPPRKTAFVPLLVGELGAVLIASLIGATADSQIGGVVAFIFLTFLVGFFGWMEYKKYSQRHQEYRQKQIAHQEKVNKYPLSFTNWENQRETQLQRYNREIQLWEASNTRERQKHQEEIRKWERKKGELEKTYQRQIEESRTSDKIAQWRQEELKKRIASLQPYPLGDRVTDFDPRGYAEFPDNCPFSNLLEQYFGSDRIYILHRMNGRIPDFAYIDRSNNLYIDIEIDEPYTPRQYPNSNKELKLTHCLEQYDCEDRDRLFTNSDWFVIHFSERQILCQTESCCKQIAQLICELTKNELALSQLAHVMNLRPEPRWTVQEAEAMANSKKRLNYYRQSSNNMSYIRPILSGER